MRWRTAVTDGLMRHPARLVALGFAAAILIGTLLLWLPVASAGPGRPAFSVALFSATSTVTVTGLTVVDTGSYWSWFGQGVIIVLMEVGGIGAARISLADSVYPVRKVRWMIAMSRTSIGCSLDMFAPPGP